MTLSAEHWISSCPILQSYSAPFLAEPSGDSAENEPAVTVTDLSLHEETYGPRVRPLCGSPSTKRDEEVTPADIPKQWQEARANRRMQFKVGNCRNGSWESNIRLLTGTIKVDWIQLPVEQYLAALPTLKQSVIAGVFRQKGAAPWGITNAEKLQLSVFLPNDPNELSMEDWYAGVCGLPTVWPEVSMMGADHLRKVAGYDFHDLRRKYDVCQNHVG